MANDYFSANLFIVGYDSGIVCALGKLADSKVCNVFCQAYTSLIRGVPDLVLMMLIFFWFAVFTQ
ncbi:MULTISPECIES: hypothetical protein [unclassified Gilliamella]|uniref:hypothetical protein n=1 Tax=unclassified Gilliamella TaxID=2685620 RepID=UPI0013077754|nr:MULTISPECIES: hypothetical protein [unclassified Gilliamella]MWP49573.1 hypothetical protein [Gilliamella sp. Lep-s35]MWP69338.1 hypothetical protein [Gilliamella sp. Lep-s5]MWP77607.1 hypothetical protein [Gilliamella sp. Lep-s21]